MTLEQYLEDKQITQSDLILIEKLNIFSEESDFLIGVLVYAETENDKKSLLNTLIKEKMFRTKAFSYMLWNWI